MNKITIIKISAVLIFIILWFSEFFHIVNGKVILQIQLIIFGVWYILNGYFSYIKSKKRGNIGVILTGILMIIVFLIITFLK